ncbi:glycosyltransferase family 2 protein [Polynucleobacter paneuropaeus]|nr:glycosyltransferase family 2 protein [Polynucleobacter paneuropaeus]
MIVPRLSIIVPTRERADTLLYTLQTIVEQKYQQCEIIVSDNYSQDNTKQVVESFFDDRINYLNTGKRVSMSENWEFALKHARGDFITYIGDDDGFIPDAVGSAMEILDKHKLNALVWEKAEYCWLDYVDERMRNWISLKNDSYTLQIVSGPNKLRKVMKFREGYTKLPCLYNGIVRKCLVDSLRLQSSNGIFFNSISPDVFSGIALSMAVGNYLSTDYPFSVNGASRFSNGTSFMRQKAGKENQSPSAKFLAENNYEYDSRILLAPSTITCLMGEYMQAKRYLSSLELPDPSWGLYVKSLIKSANRVFLPYEVLQSAAYTAKKIGLKIKIPECLDNVNNILSPNIGFARDRFNFISPNKMVENIYDACQLVAGMLPKASLIDIRSPASVFMRRIAACFLIELKKLYRSS